MHIVDGVQIIGAEDNLAALDTGARLRLIIRVTREIFEQFFRSLQEIGWEKVPDSGAEYYRPPELGGDCFSCEMAFRGVAEQRTTYPKIKVFLR